MIDHDIFDLLGARNQDAVFLLLKLERYHGGNDRFIMAKPMAASMEMDLVPLASRPRSISRSRRHQMHPPRRARTARPTNLWLGRDKGSKGYGIISQSNLHPSSCPGPPLKGQNSGRAIPNAQHDIGY